MSKSIYRQIIIFISRSVAKVFLFIALSISTPAVNAMRSLEEREAIVIIMDNSTFRRRERGLIRRLGYQPELQFIFYEAGAYGL
jgi:hypothetical protein